MVRTSFSLVLLASTLVLFSFQWLQPVIASSIPQQQLVLKQDDNAILQEQLPTSAYTTTSSASSTLMAPKSLENLYVDIVGQVMKTATRNIALSAPYVYANFCKSAVRKAGHCRPLMRSFAQSVRGHLKFMRLNMLASVQPLLDANTLEILHTDRSQATQFEKLALENPTKIVVELNKRIGDQLAMIINADEAADIIIRQSVSNNQARLPHTVSDQHLISKTFRDWKKKVTLNEGECTAEIASIIPQRSTRRACHGMSLMPMTSSMHRHDLDEEQIVTLVAWLGPRLFGIESAMRAEFDKRVQDMVASIKSDLQTDESS